jgi:heme exporter protein B
LAAEAAAVLQKDLAVEWRTRHGVYTAMLFAVMTVVALALATAGSELTPEAQAGLLWVGLMFAAVTGLARGFVVEEEQGTADLLRLAARPAAVLAGKMLFHFVLLVATEVVLVPLALLLLEMRVVHWGVFAGGLALGSIGLAVCVSISGALIALAVATTKASLGAAEVAAGLRGIVGMLGWSVALGAAGFWLFDTVWRE